MGVRNVVAALLVALLAVLGGGVGVASAADGRIRCLDVEDRDVGLGDSGQYVVEVQCLLNMTISTATHPSIQIDGSFGQLTRAKVVKFQQCANARGAGLVVDGRVGAKTAPHLRWWGDWGPHHIC